MERRLAAVTDSGIERCDQQDPRAAGKLAEERVRRQKKGSAAGPMESRSQPRVQLG